MTDTPNPPAFPHDEKQGDGTFWYSHSGMSLRDWFAGQALVAAGASGPRDDEVNDLAGAIARSAYQIADAMLAQRAKDPQP